MTRTNLAYAPKGLIGVFTPQANTTVEPEMALLTPPGYAFVNARMTSPKPTIPERLVDYMEQFPAPLAQFANAPIDVVALACTGASYLIGLGREERLLADITARTGAPALTGASASVDALRVLGARRIALVSPYNSALDAESAGFWRGCGFDVVAEASAFRDSGAFHPIYSLAAGEATAALDGLDPGGIDAVLMLGTGMPTLPAIAARPRLGDAPVISCMLALAWRAVTHRDPSVHSRETLLAWIDGAHWKPRLAAHFGA